MMRRKMPPGLTPMHMSIYAPEEFAGVSINYFKLQSTEAKLQRLTPSRNTSNLINAEGNDDDMLADGNFII